VAEGHDLVVAAGGDGTIREVTAALLGTDTMLGILPLGSAMNVPRALGIPRELDAALELLKARARIERIDIGRVGEHLFLEAAGVGPTAVVLHLLGQVDKDKGRWRAVRALIRYLRLLGPMRMVVETENFTWRGRTLGLICSNTPFTGAAVPLAPAARLNDGVLHSKLFVVRGKVGLARAWLRVALGHPPDPSEVMEYTTPKQTILTRRTAPVHADDTLAGRTPATFEVLPGAITVIAGPQAPGLDP
jgi:diacylglycerol kinase (ATP)